MKITTKMIEAGYKVSVDVYQGKLVKKKAIDYLVDKIGMNRNSASSYILNFKAMMDGEKYVRTNNNAEQTDYLLTHIFRDYGVIKLGNAIKSANKHIEYYEGLGKTKLKSIKTIIAQHEKILSSNMIPIYPDELDKTESLFEGIPKTVQVNSYERNQVARAKCIEHYGVQCVVCGFDFEKAYGEIGKGFIHVHHLTQLSEIREGYEVDPINDLNPVCPNCHAMLHKRNPPYAIDEIKVKRKI
ncbi:HNH endonuclease [Methylovulum miyakonense]|uniref:HNH endonuclease n=1 Tax=Methylovulum miyakonense TaxID=645578 RepID=UPI00037CDD51|nr:HNH endonuclease [Methylovulum miyakonense]